MLIDEYTGWDNLNAPGFTLSNSLWALIPLEAWRRGLNVELAPGARYTISDENRSYSFWQTRLTGGAWDQRAKMSDDKQLARERFLDFGLPAPIGELFSQDTPELEFADYADVIGYPVCVKPNNLAKGLGVHPKVNDRDGVIDAVRAIRDLGKTSGIIVENHVPGVDLRVSVVGDKVIGATLRTAAYVLGDGVSTVQQLVKKRNIERKVNPHLGLNPIGEDSVAEGYLYSQGYSWDSVPSVKERVALSGPANISAGGDSVDVTDEMSEAAKSIAVSAVESMGLLHGGVDLLLNDYAHENANIFVNELNPSSGLGPHIYPGVGLRRDIPSAIVDYYFPGSKQLEGSRNWVFALDEASRLFRDKVAGAVQLVPLTIPKDPVWRRYVVDATAKSVGTFRNGALGILRKRDVNGYFGRLEENKYQVAFCGERTSVEKVDRSLKNLATRSSSTLRLASRAAFTSAPGVRAV